MVDAAKPKFVKLNDDNYANWKFKMEMLLRKQNLWKKVIETAKPTAALGTAGAITNQDAMDKWDEQDDEARGSIGLAVEDDQLAHIRKSKTAKEAWEALKNYHEKNTLARKVDLVRTICALKLEEGGNAKAHINRMQDLFTQLSDIGETQLSTLWSKIFLLSSLPKSYNTLVSTLGARNEDEVTFDVAKRTIIAEYERNTANGTSASTSDDTLLRTVETNIVCFFCKLRGHQKKNCQKYKQWLAKKNKGGGKKSNGKSSDKVNSVEDSNFLFSVGKAHKGWLIDSGATRHVVNNKKFYTNIDESYKASVELADGASTKIDGIGTGILSFLDESGRIHKAKATEVLYAPNLVGNILSVRQLAKHGFEVTFNDKICQIMHKGKQIGVADAVGDLYVLRQPDSVCTLLSHNQNCIHELHRKIGHRDPAAIRKMALNGSINGLKIVECGVKEVCDTCMKGKMTRLPFPKKSKSESSAILDLVHSDVCGPMRTMTPSGKRWIVTLIDDFSGFTFVVLLTHKSEVDETIKCFVALCENKFGRKPKVIRSDRGGEYTSNENKKFLRSQGIRMELTAADCPQQNGKAERKNRTLMEMARCMLIDAGLPNSFWGEAIATANFIQNRVISRTTNMTPYERWNGIKPGIDSFQIFGSKCFVHVSPAKRGKLDDVAVEMIFLGYDDNSKAYRCYNAATRKVVVSRDVRFGKPINSSNKISIDLTSNSKVSNAEVIQKENVSVQEEQVDIPAHDEMLNDHESTVSEYATADEEIDSDDTIINGNDEDEQQTQPARRVSQRSTKGIPPRRLINEINMVRELNEPKSYNEAIQGDERVQWLTAMQEEIEAHEHNGTWELVDLPPGKTAIGSKWVFKVKTSADGEVQRHKARFVARGYSQKFGEDYDEVFAPVVMHTTFRTLLSVAAKRKMLVHHFDAKTAFLNGKLKETIYMKQPEGFDNDDSKVCLLKKSIYGLKQAARSWNTALHKVLIEANFQQSYNDPCLYSKKFGNQFCYVIVYVDDLIVACQTIERMKEIECIFKPHFVMHDLGQINYYLGMQVTKDDNENFELNQSAYIMKIVSDFGLQNAKPAKTPMDVGYGKSNSSQPLNGNKKYRSLIGRLLYLSINSRPDISASISILAQKVSKQTDEDWNQLKRVVKYLKATHHLKLKLSNIQAENLSLFGYADATWADDKLDRKSISGRIVHFNGGTISWSSNKQNLVASSSCEAEFISISEASKEIKWLRQLLEEMHEKIDGPTTIFEDNQSCIELVRDHKFSCKTKHMDTRYKMIRDLIGQKIIECEYCPSEEMVADLLTKPLSAIKHNYLREKCNLV